MNAYCKEWLVEWRSKDTAKASEKVGMSIEPNHGLRNAISPQLEIPDADDEFKYIPRFIGIEDVVALWEEIGSFPQTRLGHIINSNEPALIMVDELGSYLSASDERRAWAKKFVLKCWRKPRLRYAATRIDSRVGWWVDDLVRAIYEGQPAQAPESAGSEKPLLRKDCRVTGKRERQIEAIELAAKELKYSDLLNLPTGARAAIKAHCIGWTEFGHSEDAFKRAWAEANKQGHIRLAEKDKYTM